MIYIAGQQTDAGTLGRDYAENSVERKIIDTLAASAKPYRYDSLRELQFELKLRSEIIRSANDLAKSGLVFEVFRKSKCNLDFWERRENGGFSLKPGVKPSDAIRDIFEHGNKYATECATAMVIVYFKALLNLFPEEQFNQLFSEIYLMNWHNIHRLLREVGYMNAEKDYLPGDRRYFANPEVDPVTPELQGENVIDLHNQLYYGHGMGKRKADAIIEALNRHRKAGATQSAHLLDSAGRPNFKNLAKIYYNP